jgi:hypothetical protein
MRIASLLFAFLLASVATSQVELQVAGGHYEDVASCVLPTDNGVLLLGNTSSQDNGFARGYMAFYDNDFDFAWSAITPFNPQFVSETIVDAEFGTNIGTDDIVILTRTLNFTNYNTSLYTLTPGETEGTFYSQETIIESTSNQNPVALVNWRESLYAIGDEEGDAWMIDLGNEFAIEMAEYQYWGHPERTEKITAARVQGDTLYVTGSTLVDGVEQTTVWCWGPNGAPMWAIIQPDPDTYGDNCGADLSVHEGGATLMYNHDREESSMGHGLVRFDIPGGTPSIAMSVTGNIYADGVRMIQRNETQYKLSTNDLFNNLGLDIVITRLGFFGGYLNSSRLGNEFNNIAEDMAITDDGVIYIAGTSWGYLNGSSSMCLYKIASEDEIGQIHNDAITLSLLNDPLFYNESNISDLAVQPTTLYPNPASTTINLSSHSDWRLYSAQGALLLTGDGTRLDVSTLPTGTYFVIQDGYTAAPVQIIH